MSPTVYEEYTITHEYITGDTNKVCDLVNTMMFINLILSVKA